MEDNQTEVPTNLGKEVQKEAELSTPVKKQNRIENILFILVTIFFGLVILSICLGGFVAYQTYTGKNLINIELPKFLQRNNTNNETDNSSESPNSSETEDTSDSQEEENSQETSEPASKSEAIAYNNEIVNLQIELVQNFQVLGQSLLAQNAEESDVAYNKALGSVIKSVDKMNTIKIIDGGEQLQQAALELFIFYLDTLKTDYSLILESLKQNGEIEQQKTQELIKKITIQEAKLDLSFRKGQQKLADHYDFELQ